MMCYLVFLFIIQDNTLCFLCRNYKSVSTTRNFVLQNFQKMNMIFLVKIQKFRCTIMLGLFLAVLLIIAPSLERRLLELQSTSGRKSKQINEASEL